MTTAPLNPKALARAEGGGLVSSAMWKDRLRRALGPKDICCPKCNAGIGCACDTESGAAHRARKNRAHDFAVVAFPVRNCEREHFDSLVGGPET